MDWSWLMGKRCSNPRLVKIHRNYTVEEIASLFGVHKNTVRRWLKDGLPTSDNQRPLLVLGPVLREFLQNKRQQNKRTCKPGEIYCVRCREPRSPAGNMADYQALTDTQGNLVGICPWCESIIYRRINPTKLEQIRGQLMVTIPKAPPRINESTQPSVNSDFKEKAENHAKTQPKQ